MVLPADAKVVVESNLSMRSGNAVGLENISGISYENATSSNKLKLGIDYSYISRDYEKSGENVRVYEEYEQEISNTNLYWMLDSSFEYDYSSDLERRITGSPGVGATIIKNKLLKLTLDAGTSYAVEKYKGLDLEDKVLLRGRERFSWEVAGGVDFEQEVEIFPEIDDLDNYRLEGEASLVVSVVKGFKVKGSVRNVYRSHVRLGKEHNDTITSLGLLYEF